MNDLPRQLYDSCNERQEWTGLACPHCGLELKRVIATGFEFCPNYDHELICDYQRDPPLTRGG